MFHLQNHSLDKLSAAYLLPVVPAVVAAASGSLVASVLPPDYAFITLCVSCAMMGAGIALSLIVITLFFLRLSVHKLPTREVIVSSFIPLGALGQGVIGIVNFGVVARNVLPAVGFADAAAGNVGFVMCTVLGLALWGLSVWWFVHAVGSVSIRVLSVKKALPVNIGYWGFIFPVGSFTVATSALGSALPSVFLNVVSVVCLVAMAILFLGVAAVTGRAAWRGELKAPCLQDVVPPPVAPVTGHGEATLDSSMPNVAKDARETGRGGARDLDVEAGVANEHRVEEKDARSNVEAEIVQT